MTHLGAVLALLFNAGVSHPMAFVSRDTVDELERVSESMSGIRASRQGGDAESVVSIGGGDSGSWTLTFGPGLPVILRRRITAALVALSLVPGREGTALHRNIFGGNVDGAVYLDWLRSRVSRLRLGDCPSVADACALGEGELTIPADAVGSWLGYKSVDIWLMFVHEARHLDGWLHQSCVEELAPIPGDSLSPHVAGICDLAPDGPFGAEVVMARNLESFCSNCEWNGDVRRALNRAESRIGSREARLALSEDFRQ